MYISGDHLNELIEKVSTLYQGISAEDSAELNSLVNRFGDRIMQALANEPPPFLPEERERYYAMQRQAILRAAFDLGRVWQMELESDAGPTAFRDVIAGLDFDNEQ